MSEAQIKRVKELLALGWQPADPTDTRPPIRGGPVAMLDPSGKRWFVNSDGKLCEA